MGLIPPVHMYQWCQEPYDNCKHDPTLRPARLLLQAVNSGRTHSSHLLAQVSLPNDGREMGSGWNRAQKEGGIGGTIQDLGRLAKVNKQHHCYSLCEPKSVIPGPSRPNPAWEAYPRSKGTNVPLFWEDLQECSTTGHRVHPRNKATSSGEEENRILLSWMWWVNNTCITNKKIINFNKLQ